MTARQALGERGHIVPSAVGTHMSVRYHLGVLLCFPFRIEPSGRTVVRQLPAAMPSRSTQHSS